MAGKAGWPDSSGSGSPLQAKLEGQTAGSTDARASDSLEAVPSSLGSGSGTSMRSSRRSPNRLALDAQAFIQAGGRSQNGPLRDARMGVRPELRDGSAGAELSSGTGSFNLWADDVPVVGQSNPDR